MSRLARIYTIIGSNPLIAVEFIWALALVVDGVYLLTPDYMPATGSALAAFASAPIVGQLIAALYIVTGLVALVACVKNHARLRNISTMMFFLAFVFTVIIRILTVGFIPTVWVWPLLLGLT